MAETYEQWVVGFRGAPRAPTPDESAWTLDRREAVHALLVAMEPTDKHLPAEEIRQTIIAEASALADEALAELRKRREAGVFGSQVYENERGNLGANATAPAICPKCERPASLDLPHLCARSDGAESWGAKVTTEIRRLERLAEDRLGIIERARQLNSEHLAEQVALRQARDEAMAKMREAEATARMHYDMRVNAEAGMRNTAKRADAAESEIAALKRAFHADASHKSALAALADELRARAEAAEALADQAEQKRSTAVNQLASTFRRLDSAESLLKETLGAIRRILDANHGEPDTEEGQAEGLAAELDADRALAKAKAAGYVPEGA